jgi:hypothetical protein
MNSMIWLLWHTLYIAYFIDDSINQSLSICLINWALIATSETMFWSSSWESLQSCKAERVLIILDLFCIPPVLVQFRTEVHRTQEQAKGRRLRGVARKNPGPQSHATASARPWHLGRRQVYSPVFVWIPKNQSKNKLTWNHLLSHMPRPGQYLMLATPARHYSTNLRMEQCQAQADSQLSPPELLDRLSTGHSGGNLP